MPTQTAVIEKVTPELAKKYLGTNKDYQRRISPSTVRGYAREMKRGAFKLTHQGIAFDILGRLQDGQHRMLAVIESGTTQYFWVFRNMPVENFPLIDTGRTRSAIDGLSIEKHANPQKKAAIAKFLLDYTKNPERYYSVGTSYSITSKHFISNAEVVNFVSDNNVEMESVIAISNVWANKFKLLEQRYMAVLYWLVITEDKQKAINFFKQLSSGIGMVEDSPVHLLRKRLEANLADKNKMPNPEKFILTVKAWNAYVTGTPMKRLVYVRGTEIPEIASSKD